MIDSGIMGCFRRKVEYSSHRTSPAAPTASGTYVRQEDQAYIVPPHESGIKKEVIDPTKVTEPSQSIFRNPSSRDCDGTYVVLMKKMMTT